MNILYLGFSVAYLTTLTPPLDPPEPAPVRSLWYSSSILDEIVSISTST